MLWIALSLPLFAQDRPTPPVVGGAPADYGAWPDAAGISYRGDVSCSGVLIHPRVVLTAGHCAGGITQVHLNTVDYEDNEGEVIDVAQTFAYPNWESTYDISALLLETPATVAPRLIASGCVADEIKNGGEVAIVGFGAHDEWGWEYDSVLREAFTVITDAAGESSDGGYHSSVSPGGELGAGGAGIDACYGDSGGPLYLLTDRGNFLVGLTSRSYDYVDVPCAEGGIYTRPDAVIDWIEEVTGQTLTRPTCNSAPEPTAPVLLIKKNHSGLLTVSANDPDAGDTHTLEIVEPPAHGDLEVTEGLQFRYTPEDGYLGEDTALLRVVDSGDPTASGEVAIEIDVLSRADWNEVMGEGCGCASPGLTGGFSLLALILPFVGRRRRL